MKAGDERVAAERHERRDRRRLHSGNLLDPFDDTIREREPRRQRTAHRLDVEARHDAVIEIEAEIEADDPHLAAQAQRRHDEQRQRQRHLPDDERAAKVDAAWPAQPLLAEPGEQVERARPQRGRDTAKERGQRDEQPVPAPAAGDRARTSVPGADA